MSSYKPKIYRSQDGCCICKAKSSSSRFTASQKYEEDCNGCFKLDGERRFGDICNACVLIVKRWKKLPKDTKKNWAHVVDARTGPGTKNVTKQKKKETPSFVFEKFKYKHVYKKKVKGEDNSVTSNRSETPIVKQEDQMPSFLDKSYWRREEICCGVIYVGDMGEVMVDQRLYKKCSAQFHGRRVSQPTTMETLVEAELQAFQSENGVNNREIENDEFFSDSDSKPVTMVKEAAIIIDYDGDEGFYDKIEQKMDRFESVSELIISH